MSADVFVHRDELICHLLILACEYTVPAADRWFPNWGPKGLLGVTAQRVCCKITYHCYFILYIYKIKWKKIEDH